MRDHGLDIDQTTRHKINGEIIHSRTVAVRALDVELALANDKPRHCQVDSMGIADLPSAPLPCQVALLGVDGWPTCT